MRVLVFLVVGVLASWAPAVGQMSKQELLELVESGAEESLIVSLIQRDCVEFPVDAKAVAELAGKVPRQVIQAAIDCGSTPPESRLCTIYRALTSDERLAEFPVVVRWFRGGNLRLLEISSGVWMDERGITGGLKKRFRAMGEYTEMHMAAVEAIKDLPGVRDYLFDSDPDLTGAELAAMQRDAVLEACSQRVRLKVTSEPGGAAVFLDGKRVGSTPARLELLAGEHLLEIEKKDFERHSERLILREGETHEVEVALVQQGSFEITSEPSEAVVMIDGSFAGHTPLQVYVDSGFHSIRFVRRGHWPLDVEVGVGRGETVPLEARFDPPPEDYCLEATAKGPVSKGWKALAKELEGARLRLEVPLYEVVSSSTEREIPSTHVVDARRVVFEPGTGDEFVESPWDLLGKDLGGLAFGEVGIDLLETAPGGITITKVERKKTALKLELLHESGDRNALFLDFTRNLDFVEVADVMAALCVVAVRADAVFETSEEEQAPES